MSEKIYITTPIYYVNDIAHIGHAYTTIIADTLNRYFKLLGHESFFLTGTDEHGQKIEESALKRGKSPKEYADEISLTFKNLWDDFEIGYDKFIRTTDEKHKLGVQKAFLKMYEKGDIYKDVYSGHYCVSCETFFPKTQLVDEEFCPECGRSTIIVEEESYFFKLSKYQDKLLEWYKSDPNIILPKNKRNEVLRFIEGGLEDLSITRTSFDWGVKLPSQLNDPKHVMYVWLDALMNYVTALGYGGDEEHMKFYPASYHLIGKDILRFHAIFWPAFLMSLDLPLPKHIASHGWWTRNGEKMSKSKGNVVNPREVASAYGLENFRYFMLREVAFGGDGDFSQKALIDRINSDLGNDLGNLLNRVIGMSGKYFDGKIESSRLYELYGDEMRDVNGIIDSLGSYFVEMQLHKYLEELWKVLSIANKSIDKYQPWNLMKESKTDEAMGLNALIANILAKVALMLYPVMPKNMQKIASALGFEIDTHSFQKFIKDKDVLGDFVIEKIPPLFPRIEEALLHEAQPQVTVKVKPIKESKVEISNLDENNANVAIVGIEQFFQTVLKVGTVVEASEVPKSSKLLFLKVDLGEERPREIVSGIKEYYSADELVDTQVCVVSNLKPAKLMGIRSEGMILAVKDEDGLVLIRPEKKKKIGTVIS
ncbi:MAG: methionyl-tRNA synthetase [Sulfurovum sp. AS07-7]|nr:MAG: methionyl-tRNA synthetase [Sulfurovum sp. AS07-7]